MQWFMWLLIAVPVLLVAGKFWGRLLRKAIGEAIRFAEGQRHMPDLAAMAKDGALPARAQKRARHGGRQGFARRVLRGAPGVVAVGPVVAHGLGSFDLRVRPVQPGVPAGGAPRRLDAREGDV